MNFLEEFALTTIDHVALLFEEHPYEELINILREADDDYTNGIESDLSDAQYDAIRRQAEIRQPHHVYFTGVGSEVRGGKVKLPHPMGSLNQKFEGDIAGWLSDNNLKQDRFIITDKLDGTSAMAIYQGHNKPFKIGYSRGDGTEGADVSRHLSHIVPDSIDTPTSMAIRGEVILSKLGFMYLQDQVMNSKGEPYKNARNMVAGLMNSKTVDPMVYDHLCFVAYEIVGVQMGKHEMLQMLAAMGFLIPHWQLWYGTELRDDDLATYLTERREKTKFEIDGIVIDVDEVYKRMELNPSIYSLNPEYSFKYKVLDPDNYAETVITRIEWRLSKHGYIKPRVHVAPVHLVGVTITHANGLHAKFVSDNQLRPGSKVAISRMGDVVPNIVRVLGHPDDMPDRDYQNWLADEFDSFGADWEWTETYVDVRLTSKVGNKAIIVKQLLDFFEKIDVAYLGMSSIEKLYDFGCRTPDDIINCTPMVMLDVLGENGRKVVYSIADRLENIPLYKLVGAHSTQRGIGVRKMKKLEDALGQDFINKASVNRCELVDGFDTITATAAVEAVKEFNIFFPLIKDMVTLAEPPSANTPVSGLKICFTGFRNKDLQAQVEADGGTMQSTVSSKTDIVVTTDPNGTSGKLKKARALDKKILSVQEFTTLVGG